MWAHFPRKWQQNLLQARVSTFLEADHTAKKCKLYNTCGDRTACRTDVDLHRNQGIFVVVSDWVFLSMRVEGMISCVDVIFLSILLNDNFLLSRVFPKSWGFARSVDQNICVFMCERILQY